MKSSKIPAFTAFTTFNKDDDKTNHKNTDLIIKIDIACLIILIILAILISIGAAIYIIKKKPYLHNTTSKNVIYV